MLTLKATSSLTGDIVTRRLAIEPGAKFSGNCSMTAETSAPMEEKKPKNPQKTVKSLNNYAKYSSLAFQMIVIILLVVFGGIKLDKWLKLEFPVFTVVLSLAGTCVWLFIMALKISSE